LGITARPDPSFQEKLRSLGIFCLSHCLIFIQFETMQRRGNISSVTGQAVEILKDGMLTGRWKNTLPGRLLLAEELGVSEMTIEEAMRRLAKDGLLKAQGPGKRRLIILPEGKEMQRDLLIRILAYESVDRGSGLLIDLVEKLNKAGFRADYAPKSMLDLGMDVKRVARMVNQNPADAWIVVAGSRHVLDWFNEQAMTVYAYFGQQSDISIAGCSGRRDIESQVRCLVELGHRRIVLLAREEHIKPVPSSTAQNFIKALKNVGIEPGSYNLPEWGYRPEGLYRCLESLFKVTPPSALFVEEPGMLMAVRDYLSEHGMIVPRDVSLICNEQNPLFSWCNPPLAHYSFNLNSLNRRVVRWAKQIALGKDDRRQIFITAKFVDGGTIGPAPKGRSIQG
jgi:DNA-binding transcriptional regulator YhcF (GntR family)